MRIVCCACKFLIVACKVLWTSRSAEGLNTFYAGRSHFSAQIRVFREILKVSSAQRISVDIHTRSKQYITALFFHFSGKDCVHFFNKFGVECARKKCADRKQRTARSKSNSRWSVCCDNRLNALVTQAFKNTAVCSGVAFCTERRVHFVVASCDCFKFNIVKLCHKFFKCCLAVFYIL